jgi:hypothetical protein
MCVPATNLRGFVQEIHQFPFGLLLLSAIQVILMSQLLFITKLKADL